MLAEDYNDVQTMYNQLDEDTKNQIKAIFDDVDIMSDKAEAEMWFNELGGDDDNMQTKYNELRAKFGLPALEPSP